MRYLLEKTTKSLIRSVIRVMPQSIRNYSLKYITKSTLKFHSIRYPLQICAKFIAAISRIFRRSRNQIVILTPAVEGSRGDEAMLITAIIELKKMESGPMVMLSYKKTEQHSNLVNQHKVQVLSLQELAIKPWLLIAILANTKKFVFIGADVVDGVYGVRKSLVRIAITEMFCRAGAQSAIVGFSVSENPNSECVKMLKRLPHQLDLFVRDPVSRGRLESALDRKLLQSADLAFLLEPDLNGIDRTVVKWIKDDSIASIVGIGVNALLCDPDSLQDVMSFVDVIDHLVRQGNKVVLVSHDIRDSVSDLALVNQIYEFLSENVRQHVLVLTSLYSASQLKYIAGQMDLILSARMHFAIAGLSQGVPVLGLRYQGKFEGLYQLLGLSDFAMLIDAKTMTEDPLQVVEKLDLIKSNSIAIRQAIFEKLPEIRRLAMSNFGG